MKRLLGFCGVAVFLIVFGLFAKFDAGAKQCNAQQKYTYKVYVSALDELEHLPNSAQVVDLGFCYEVLSDFQIQTASTQKTLGRTTTFACAKEDINRILANNSICVEKCYQIGTCLVFEGYQRRSAFETTKVQVAYNLGQLSIGTPVIFGSY